MNNWWNRLISAIFGGRLSEQTEQYLAHQTKRDYVCNTIGQAAWGTLFPLLTLVATWLVGPEQAGQFSMAYTVGMLLLFVANYGVRTYQVSDLDDMHSFFDYQINRFITCAVMLVVGWLWYHLRGYDASMFAICMGVLVFRAADGLADVYEGRLQQKDKLYLAGLSQAVRCVLGLLFFSAVLLLTRSLPMASFALAAGAVVSLVLLTVPLAYFETEHSLPATARGVKELFVDCFPLFLALFLYNLIDSVPKFAMEGALSYDNQLYYNAMYFPAHSILMVAGFIYKPQLVRLARIWDDPEKHRRFDLLVLAMVGVIALIAAAMALVMGTVGIPLMSFMYGLDFEQFRPLVYVMVATGGVCASIDFLYQIVTVLRAQEQVSKLYLIAIVFAVPVSMLLVNFSGLAGAVMGSLVSMAILLVLLVMEYARIRRQAERGY
ncbi:lipopolysaccharide biosynthesis protein [Olsenella profusa]|uniref:Lipopolysaccharide biosynthesis protein n=1 Tax=Olsenella profusa TaxID=138595 RepID=A0ABS2F2L5_9ACTN|nr:lipopolysaccharide biosynthesis protein [Olsenella profusa]